MLPDRRCCLSSHILLFFSFPVLSAALPFPNSSVHLHAHPDPDSVARQVQRQVADSQRRALLAAADKDHCLTGNTIDDCWRCYSTDWRQDRQRLAECGIGFGRYALGGKGGPIYVVTDASDRDPVNPAPGTLRYGAIQEGPLWIIFARDMTIRLNEELLVNSFKTIDGRGAVVHIAGGACITLQYVSNVIIHNLHIHHCVPAGKANVRSSPTHYGWRSRSDGDGISIYGGRKIWVDHCALSYCADGLIDAIMGSTAITISNSHFSHHDDVMLLGHSDDYLPDSGMQVTIAFNRFGEELVQRMPRCRRGYFHVVNNDFTSWEMYAIGGSANPTVNSQGNRYIAPANRNAKEVTKRVDTEEKEWSGWNWRTEGDVMVNGAFFVASGAGAGIEAKYTMAESVDPKSAALIDQLIMNAGVLGGASFQEVCLRIALICRFSSCLKVASAELDWRSIEGLSMICFLCFIWISARTSGITAVAQSIQESPMVAPPLRLQMVAVVVIEESKFSAMDPLEWCSLAVHHHLHLTGLYPSSLPCSLLLSCCSIVCINS